MFKRFYRISSGRSGRLTRAKRREELFPSHHSVVSSAPNAQLRFLERSKPSLTAPALQGVTPPPATVSRPGGFLGTVMDGLAHGVGWAFGMRAVDALFGSRQMDIVHQHNDISQPLSGEPSHDVFAGNTSSTQAPADGGMVDDQWSWGHEAEQNSGDDSWGNFDIDL